MQVHINDAIKPHVAFYLCGSIAFMRMAQYTLKLLGYADDQIRKEQFVIETKTFVPLLNDASIKHVTVNIKQKQFGFDVQYPQSILNAALSNGIHLPYSCKAGICSACTAKCLQGNVVMGNNDVLTNNDIATGLVLTCVGYAATDILLQFD
jgi:ring-1,2-phenylacetyl-CoA epoxidase subunit PaaE